MSGAYAVLTIPVFNDYHQADHESDGQRTVVNDEVHFVHERKQPEILSERGSHD